MLLTAIIEVVEVDLAECELPVNRSLNLNHHRNKLELLEMPTCISTEGRALEHKFHEHIEQVNVLKDGGGLHLLQDSM